MEVCLVEVKSEVEFEEECGFVNLCVEVFDVEAGEGDGEVVVVSE